MQSLVDDNCEPVLFLSVTPNPKGHEVMAGVERYHAADCDVIVAIGGGSVIDCAKGIGVVIANGGHILDFAGIDNVPVPGPPVICIPTTAGSAADVSQFAVVTDPERRAKVAIMSKALVPDVSLADPLTTTTCDHRLTAICGMDILAHAIESFVSRAGSPIVDLHALEAIRLLRQSLPRIIAEPDHLPTREALMRASMHAGLAFSNACLGAVHAMAHALGGMHDLPHGELNGALIEHVIGFNFPAAPERHCRIGEALGLQLSGLPEHRQAGALRADIAAFRREVGLVAGLSELGVSAADVPELAERAVADICLVTNPRPANHRDLEVLYAEAL